MIRAFATNPTTAGTAVTQPADVRDDPAGTVGYHDLGRGGCKAPNGLFIKPFAIGADNVTFLMALFAVDRIINKSGTHVPPQWTHTLLAAFTCTASAHLGLVGGNVLNTERYADTIIIIANHGNANISHEAVSPVADLGGHVVADVKGAEQVAFKFWMNASATSANALFRPI